MTTKTAPSIIGVKINKNLQVFHNQTYKTFEQDRPSQTIPKFMTKIPVTQHIPKFEF